MNDLLQQLLQMGPGLGAGISGNGPGMQAFMEGYQRTMHMLQQQKRQKEQDAFAAEDRTREIARQQVGDANAAQDRAQRQALQGLQIPGHLAEIGSAADTPQDAQAIIEAAMPNLMKVFGQESMAYGQPAVEQATRVITGRQKKEVQGWVDQALKTAFVADNHDADPELQLPPRIAQLLGKPSARLSELQTFAELPVGKPASKPSDTPSLQSKELLGPDGKPGVFNFDPKTGQYAPAQGVQPIPPQQRPVGDGGLTPYQEAQLTERLAKGWESSTATTREVRRQYDLMRVGLKRFREGDANGGAQAVLVTFQKILDPTSVVRESEYARTTQGISMMARLQGAMEKLQKGGAGIPEPELAGMVETARQMLAEMQSYSTTQRSRIDAVAKKNKIDPVTIFGVEGPAHTVPEAEPPHTTAQPTAKPTRGANPFRPKG